MHFYITNVMQKTTTFAKKPIISPSWTDANSIISPGLVRLVISMVQGCMRSGYQACYQSYGSVLNNL